MLGENSSGRLHKTGIVLNGEATEINFDLILIDSWDGEAWTVAANDEIVINENFKLTGGGYLSNFKFREGDNPSSGYSYTMTPLSLEDDSVRGGSNSKGFRWNYDEQVYNVSLKVPEGIQTLNLTFNDYLTQGAINNVGTSGETYWDEAWGIDNFSVGYNSVEMDDVVLASVDNYILPENVENLELQGTAALTATGNALSNEITAQSGSHNNVISGLDGADTLMGFGGDDSLLGGSHHDSLVGSAGADTLDGGTGHDTMSGGEDADYYVVDDINDVVIDDGTSSGDHIQSSATFTASPGIESLELTGTAAIDVTGNVLANELTGNAADNVLIGLEQEDTLLGHGGYDSLVGGTHGLSFF